MSHNPAYSMDTGSPARLAGMTVYTDAALVNQPTADSLAADLSAAAEQVLRGAKVMVGVLDRAVRERDAALTQTATVQAQVVHLNRTLARERAQTQGLMVDLSAQHEAARARSRARADEATASLALFSGELTGLRVKVAQQEQALLQLAEQRDRMQRQLAAT